MEHISWFSNLTKAFAALLKAGADRVALWIERRKPRLYVHFDPVISLWCIGQQQQRYGPPLEMMQVTFRADFNHDDPRQTLVITEAYPEGTTPQLGMVQKFKIPAETMVDEQVTVFVTPIVAEKGKAWTGRIVLVDQFQRKHKTKKATFRWAGP